MHLTKQFSLSILGKIKRILVSFFCNCEYNLVGSDIKFDMIRSIAQIMMKLQASESGNLREHLFQRGLMRPLRTCFLGKGGVRYVCYDVELEATPGLVTNSILFC